MIIKKLSSLSIFFPFYNDAGTIEEAMTMAHLLGKQVTDDLEVIAVHGGNSKDDTLFQIMEMKKKFPKLVVIDKSDNSIGYAVIKHGLSAATKDWVFYTDGDLQYRLGDLLSIIAEQQQTGVDVVNGYKRNRNDAIHRLILGKTYQKIAQFVFQLPIRDVDCDFRLMRKSFLKDLKLESTHAAILPELIYKLKAAGAKFSEVPVAHQARRYGKSNYKWWELSWEKMSGDTKLYFKLKKIKQNQEKSHS